MPTAVDVNLDIGEMVLKVESAGVPQIVEYNKLDRLVLFTEPMKKLFRTVEVKTIEVHVRGKEEPYFISSNKVGDFDNVEGYLLQMAEKYNVTVEH